MKITIDNNDGQGAVDFTAMLTGATPLTLERRLNAPSRCTLSLAPSAGAVASSARVVVTSDNGTTLFTGYCTAAPELVYAGVGCTGPAYLQQGVCVSEEALLDANVSRRTEECVATAAGTLLERMTKRAAAGTNLHATGDALSTIVGGFAAKTGKPWSENAGALADAARASYRVLNGTLQFASIGDEVHTLAESDGSLDRAALHGARVRRPVQDVTVYGKREPQTYVTEIFEGDGVTATFALGEVPLLEKGPVLSDAFRGSAIDSLLWSVADAGGQLSVTSRGLTVGSGQSAALGSSVSAVDTVEMGGVLMLEVTGLQIDAAGEAYVAGLASNTLDAANLFAGFHVRTNGTATVAVPVVLGVEAGASVTLQPGHTYTLRLRYHCSERQRALQSYNSGGADGPIRLGGQTLAAAADLVMEIQETTGGSLLPTVVVYDGTVTQAPAMCIPVVVNSVSFLGSIASVSLHRPGDVWVRVASGGGAAATQRLGSAAQSAQAKVNSAGVVTFYPGNVPAAGSVITMNYRLSGWAVARMTTAAGSPGGSLIVKAEEPDTRSSADCENAALALLSLSTWTDGAWKGSYTWWNAQQTSDVWPGDALLVNAPSAGVNSELLIRSVEIRGSSCSPELLQYRIRFANEWAEPVSLKYAETAPANAWLPPTALTAPAALQSLGNVAVSSVSTTQIQVQAGMNAPAGGGFEVRRSDWKFGAGDGADLVLRSPVPSFTIVREAPVERYYIRMYDGANPPNYSRFSSAIMINAATQ